MLRDPTVCVRGFQSFEPCILDVRVRIRKEKLICENVWYAMQRMLSNKITSSNILFQYRDVF